MVDFSFKDIVGGVSYRVNGKKLSIDKFARDKVWMILKAELLLLRGLLTPPDRLHPWWEHEPSLGHRVELVRAGDKVASEPVEVVPELSDLRLPDVLVIPVTREVEALVLIEHEADPDGLLPVGPHEGSGGVQLMLGHLHQDGAVRQRQGQTAHAGVREGLETLALVTGHLVILRLRRLRLEVRGLRMIIRVFLEVRTEIRILLEGTLQVIFDLRLY